MKDAKVGHCRVSTSWVTISNPDSLSSCKMLVNPVTKCSKMYLSEPAWYQISIGGVSHKEVETLQPGLEFDKFKPRLESDIFKASVG
jgi:hypothetical protein